MTVRKIFNFYQADYLIQNKATVLGCGKEDGSCYISFEFNEVFDEYMEKWRLRKR